MAMTVLVLRSLVYNIVFFATLAASCILASLFFFLPERWHVKFWNYGTMAFLAKALKVVCGLEIEVRGRENIAPAGENVLYASNHQSAMETYFLTTILKRAAFILKKELTYIPVFGWAQALYGMISVDRASGGAAMRSLLKAAKKSMDKRRPIIIFPQGTRTPAGVSGPYKSGIYFLSENLKVPVIPIALDTGLFWRKRSFLRHKGKVTIEFLPRMPDNLPKDEFMAELERRIEARCRGLEAEAIKKYPGAKATYERNTKGK